MSVVFSFVIIGLWSLAFASLPVLACFEGR